MPLVGLPFGLSKSAANYNRSSGLTVAFTTRVLLVVNMHFYDNFKSMDTSLGKGAAQEALKVNSELEGLKLSSGKSQRLSTRVAFIGCSFDYKDVCDGGSFLLDCMEGRRVVLIGAATKALDDGLFDPGSAGK